MIHPSINRMVGSRPLSLPGWADLHAAIMLIAVSTALVTRSGLPVALLAASSMTVLFIGCRSFWRAIGPLGGLANCLTAIRVVMLLSVAAFIGQWAAGLVLTLFGANLLLDVADGRTARRRSETSEFGTVLDRESDGLYVLIAYLHFYLADGIGAWLLLPGIFPFVFRLGTRYLLSWHQSEAKQTVAAYLAGINFVMILAAVLAPQRLQLFLLICSATVVSLSFAISFLKMCRK